MSVQDSEEKPVASVKASYANFVWGIPYERDSLYPSLGFSTTDTAGPRKIDRPLESFNCPVELSRSAMSSAMMCSVGISVRS